MKKINIALMVSSVIIAVVGLLLLPNPVIIQLYSDGTAANTLPKLPAVAVPLIISLGGGLRGITGNDKKDGVRGIVTAALGILLALLLLIANCVIHN